MSGAERWLELADGVFAGRYAFADQTIGVVAGDGAALVIDTRSTRGQADELRRDLAALLAQPVTAVVNTHHHYDHCFGNVRFRPLPIWGHVRCAAGLRATGDRQRAELAASAPELAAELEGLELVPPDRTFEETAFLDVGGRRVELRHLGRGHTDADVVAIVPDAGVLFAGDLLENGAPPFFDDGYPLDWPETVSRLLDHARGPVVPGHGEPSDRRFAEDQLADLLAIAELGRRVARGELPIEQAAPAGPFGPVASRRAIERAAAQARGELDPRVPGRA